MSRAALFAAALLAVVPLSVSAQGQGPTQTRDGLGSGGRSLSSTGTSPNSLPSGSENSQTGPQSRPAFPSGSTTANPGEAFVRNTPVPATGPLQTSPGALATTTTSPTTGSTTSGRPGVGEAAAPAR